MKPRHVATLLQRAIAARLPVLLTSAPGSGKSDIVAQVCAALGYDLIISHPVVSDPTDAKGLPWISPEADRATFLPFGDLAQAIHATKPTVWFLDDLGQAAPAVQASFMQLLLARRVGSHVLPDCVTFVAATNRRTDRAGVSGILEPVKSRFATIIDVEPDVDDWCDWALTHDVPAELIAFLRFRPELLSKFEPSADLSNSPVPRTWAQAGKLLALGLDAQTETAAIAGAVGAAGAAEFLGFLRMARELPSVDAILIDPDSVTIPSSPSALYAVVTALASRATKQTIGRVARFAQRLVDAHHGEFAALCIRDSLRRDPKLAQTKEFVKLAVGEFGALITGDAR